ncbi:MAG: class I SAM-dependent rRNA methyltransferase [Candidatus Omnitrophica bacterium]|nr:class I SAM-dependent rRNA methyltransferase [Candidatus Omnitrophota bacterium]
MKPIHCVLKKGKEKPLLSRHPWIFSGAIDQIEESHQAGDIVKVFSSDNKFLGLGYLNPSSQIAVRMLSFDDVSINEGFFKKRIQRALNLRRKHLPESHSLYRLIHSEGDELPGLVAERFGDYVVIQCLTAGMEKWKPIIIEILADELKPKGIFQKDDGEWREWEGLEKQVAVVWGEDLPQRVEATENGLTFLIDVRCGQKSGFFCDQRDNRRLIQDFCSGARVLNCFAYTGAFSIYAARGGAESVVSVETSQPALDLAEENRERNGFPSDRFEWVREDVADYLRSSRSTFDMIILDPPAFCRHKQQVEKAMRGYKDINLHAFKKIESGGFLFSASCSSYITPELFQQVLFQAARDAKRSVRILAKTSHALDHPVCLYHPEGEYLKGCLCQVF